MIESVKTDQIFYRTAEFDRATADKKGRTIDLSFSSEAPYERYFGIEILDHGSGVDLSFLDSGRAPLLKDHWRDEQVGVIEKAWIGDDRKGRASVRFGKSELAEQEFQDVIDGIRVNISVGYRVMKMVLESSDEETGETYRVTEWKPLEISIVSIPADESVGVGRNRENQIKSKTIKNKEVTIMHDKLEYDTKDGEIHNMEEQALRAIKNGTSLEAFRTQVLDTMAERNRAEEVYYSGPSLGLSRLEKQSFSFLRVVQAASFEFEVSRAAQRKLGKQAEGILVPFEVLAFSESNYQRDLTVGNDAAAGYLVGTDLMPSSFIEKLDNAMLIQELGATVIRDLQGDVALPKQTGRATGYWLNEGGSPTESDQAVGQVSLRPKTVGAFTDITRRLQLQSSLDAEEFVKRDLATTLALMIDLAAINGVGSQNQPLGILNTTGIGSVTINAASTPDWGDIVDLEKSIAVDNALIGNLAYLVNATIAANMKQTAKESGYPTYLMEDGRANGYKVGVSNQVPADTIIFGNFSDLIIGLWSGLDLTVDPYTHSTSGTVRVVALQDVDVALRHAESFCVGSST